MIFLLALASAGGSLLVSTPVYVLFSLSSDLKGIAGYVALASAVVWVVVVQVWVGFKLARQHQGQKRQNGG